MLIPLRLSAQTDEQLMLRAARGSDRAFEELYNRHARRLQLYAAREKYHEGNSFRAWLYTIAYNLCKNHHRNQLSIVRDDEKDMPAEANIEVELDESILHDALREALQSLPEPYAMLFSLHYEEELTIPQIAQITDLPEGTVKSRLHQKAL